MTEHQMYEAIAHYLQMKYPNVLYRFDLAADLKLTMGQARKHKMLHPRRGWPDLFIAEPKHKWCRDGSLGIYMGLAGDGETPIYSMVFGGLFLELKRDKTRLKKKNGEWATPHIAEQAEMLEKLRNKGYRAEFAVGLDEAMKMIDDYLGGGE